MKRYGPYRNQDGYWFWIDIAADGRRRTVLVSREVLAQRLGRPLLRSEDAHHIDEDRDNNAPNNLEVRDRIAHRRAHGIASFRRNMIAYDLNLEKGVAASVKARALRKRRASQRATQRARYRAENRQTFPPQEPSNAAPVRNP